MQFWADKMPGSNVRGDEGGSTGGLTKTGPPSNARFSDGSFRVDGAKLVGSF
jgi:hypothetical protein